MRELYFRKKYIHETVHTKICKNNAEMTHDYMKLLIHFSHMFHFYTPENARKSWFSDVLRGYRNNKHRDV